MTKNEQIEEIEQFIYDYVDSKQTERVYLFGSCVDELAKPFVHNKGIAEALYNAGYRKIDEFAKCRDCIAWSGTDCTRHPYTQGCLKDENNIKWQAVKEFAEWIKDNITDIPFCNQKAYNVFCDMVNEKLKEYEQ